MVLLSCYVSKMKIINNDFYQFIISFKNMYHEYIYKHHHNEQILTLYKRGYADQLTISPQNNSLYYPAMLEIGLEQKVVALLKDKPNKTELECYWLIMAVTMCSGDYTNVLRELNEKYKDEGSRNSLFQWIEKYKPIPRDPLDSKKVIHYNFQKLLGKAQCENYFKQQEVPVFLISIQWYQQFFSLREQRNSIDNQSLVNLSEYLHASDRYNHFNYEIKEGVVENQHYKLAPYEAWEYLKKLYGGLEVKRFTTLEKEPIVQIWYSKVDILVVEEKAILVKRLPILISKTQTLTELLDRITELLLSYKIITTEHTYRKWQIIKTTLLSTDEIIAQIQKSGKTIKNSKMELVSDLHLDVEDLNLMQNKHHLILNVYNGEKGIFSQLSQIKIDIYRQKCLRCGKSSNLQLCRCKTVYFCSKFCKDSHKDHEKQCNNLSRESVKLANLLEFYDVSKRKVESFHQFNKYGKIGLQNLGNTCYMNAALQCVLRINEICQYFMSNQHVEDLNVGNVLGSEGKLACAFGQLVKSYFLSNKKALQPTTILRIISLNPQFRGHNHQDSQQFLNYFLDKLHEDLNRVRNKPYIEDIESNGRPDDVVSKLSWQNYKKRNQSFISQKLAGQYRSEIKCPDCKKISITFDPFMSVTLQFPKQQKGSILEGYFMSEYGDFSKIKIQVKYSILSQEFINKYFNEEYVVGVYQKEKRIVKQWDMKKSIFENKSDTGILFFFEGMPDHQIEIDVQIYNKGKQELDNFTRKIFAKKLEKFVDLERAYYKIVKKPFCKAIEREFDDDEEYYCEIKKYNSLNIISLGSQSAQKIQYPIAPGKYVLKIEFNKNQFVNRNEVKFNISSGSYDAKIENLIKKPDKSMKIKDLLDCFSQPEQLTQDNAWYCNSCKDHKLAEKTMSLYQLPQYLIIHLKRFNHRGGRYVIYGEKVNMPIDIEDFEIINGLKYQLIGVVNHFGSLTMGHYTAFVKRDDWYYYDDEKVKRNEVTGANAYLLFYKRTV